MAVLLLGHVVLLDHPSNEQSLIDVSLPRQLTLDSPVNMPISGKSIENQHMALVGGLTNMSNP